MCSIIVQDLAMAVNGGGLLTILSKNLCEYFDKAKLDSIAIEILSSETKCGAAYFVFP